MFIKCVSVFSNRRQGECWIEDLSLPCMFFAIGTEQATRNLWEYFSEILWPCILIAVSDKNLFKILFFEYDYSFGTCRDKISTQLTKEINA